MSVDRRRALKLLGLGAPSPAAAYGAKGFALLTLTREAAVGELIAASTI